MCSDSSSGTAIPTPSSEATSTPFMGPIPPPPAKMRVVLDNVADGEDVYQRCLLVKGHVDGIGPDEHADVPEDGHVITAVTDGTGRAAFGDVSWPACKGYFKALVMLSPGLNQVTVTSSQTGAAVGRVSLRYTPLLQTPPLHLAILVARDSPLVIDCPPARYGGLSSAHADADAAVAKLRMTAYMWQALTAEDMRAKGLGRRSFRLEEEWTPETVSGRYRRGAGAGTGIMQSTAKVHLIKTDKTVAELRDHNLAQQNPAGKQRDELHAIFTRALLAHGLPFSPARETRPIVAGMILDAHYDPAADLILAHAALGAHDPNGLSLGVFGSHLAYAWPRFLEEVPASLTDTIPPGPLVGNDCGECGSMWEACAVGQGAFLHEVGHAFSAPHSSGIMTRGYSPDWARCFVSATARSECRNQDPIRPVTDETPNACTWDVRDAVAFANLAHFRLPGDPVRAPGGLTCDLIDDKDSGVRVACPAGISSIWLNGELQANSGSVADPVSHLVYGEAELAARFDRRQPLELEALSRNGARRTLDLWALLRDPCSIRVPGTTIRLGKSKVSSDDCASSGAGFWHWAVMLRRRGRRGTFVPAIKIDLRVGGALDGAVVYYSDGTTIPCGPRSVHGEDCEDPHMGGHQARKLALPADQDITRVAVSRRGGSLVGLRMWLSGGKAMGALNRADSDTDVQVLEPEPDHRIIGFYGKSGRSGMVYEFGIVTAPRDLQLPDELYDLPELQNVTGRDPYHPLDPSEDGEGGGRGRAFNSTYIPHSDMSEDSDGGYDCEGDKEFMV